MYVLARAYTSARMHGTKLQKVQTKNTHLEGSAHAGAPHVMDHE